MYALCTTRTANKPAAEVESIRTSLPTKCLEMVSRHDAELASLDAAERDRRVNQMIERLQDSLMPLSDIDQDVALEPLVLNNQRVTIDFTPKSLISDRFRVEHVAYVLSFGLPNQFWLPVPCVSHCSPTAEA